MASKISTREEAVKAVVDALMIPRGRISVAFASDMLIIRTRTQFTRKETHLNISSESVGTVVGDEYASVSGPGVTKFYDALRNGMSIGRGQPAYIGARTSSPDGKVLKSLARVLSDDIKNSSAGYYQPKTTSMSAVHAWADDV